MVLTGVEEGMAAVLNHKSGSGDKVGDVFFVALHGTKVLISYAVIKVELFGELPGILDIGIEGVDVHKPFGITDGNCGSACKSGVVMEAIACRDITRKKTRQGTHLGARCECNATRPRARRYL